MIIVNLMGGLGNQMFQYAYGHALEKRTGVPVSFSVDMFSAYNSHNGYELERVFGLHLRLATPEDRQKVLGKIWSSLGSRRLAVRVPFIQWFTNDRIIIEKEMKFESRLLQTDQASHYIHGYFQSEKYFFDYADTIRENYIFQKIEKSIETNIDQASISLHVRRGDYLSSSAVHCICGISYYTAAVSHIKKHVSDFELIVFSDDPEWAEKEMRKLHHSVRVIAENRGADSFKDMFLISRCDHHIIANSSFSWWGAWLCQNKEKIVIAPKDWFASARLSSEDIVPEAWVKL
jgi:hypothetical protein